MAEQTVSLKIPEEMIKAHVQGAIAAVLAKNPGELVQRVVEAALTQPANNYHGSRATVFEIEVQKLLVEEAKKAPADWMEEMRPLVRQAVQAKLSSRKKGEMVATAEKLADGLIAAMQREVSVSFKERY